MLLQEMRYMWPLRCHWRALYKCSAVVSESGQFYYRMRNCLWKYLCCLSFRRFHYLSLPLHFPLSFLCLCLCVRLSPSLLPSLSFSSIQWLYIRRWPRGGPDISLGTMRIYPDGLRKPPAELHAVDSGQAIGSSGKDLKDLDRGWTRHQRQTQEDGRKQIR